MAIAKLLPHRIPALLFHGLLGLTLAATLTSCSPRHDAAESRSGELPSIETNEFIPASHQGPAQNAPEPVLPAVAAENTPDGAAATIAFFWEALDYGRLTGDTRPMETVTHYVCDLCSETIYRWEKIHQDNAWADLHGASEVNVYEVHTYPAQSDAEDDVAAVLFELTEPASDFYQDGKLLAHEATEASTTTGWWAELAYDEANAGWVIHWIGYDEELAPQDTGD